MVVCHGVELGEFSGAQHFPHASGSGEWPALLCNQAVKQDRPMLSAVLGRRSGSERLHHNGFVSLCGFGECAIDM
jgi:hypothetical protein